MNRYTFDYINVVLTLINFRNGTKINYNSELFKLIIKQKQLHYFILAGEKIDLNSYIGLYVEAEVPSHDTNSEDRQLMFKCKYWEKTDDTSFLDDYSYDVKWMIDDDEVIVKSDIKKADLYTTGRLKSSDWSSRLKKIGFNVRLDNLYGTNQKDFTSFTDVIF